MKSLTVLSVLSVVGVLADAYEVAYNVECEGVNETVDTMEAANELAESCEGLYTINEEINVGAVKMLVEASGYTEIYVPVSVQEVSRHPVISISLVGEEGTHGESVASKGCTLYYGGSELTSATVTGTASSDPSATTGLNIMAVVDSQNIPAFVIAEILFELHCQEGLGISVSDLTVDAYVTQTYVGGGSSTPDATGDASTTTVSADTSAVSADTSAVSADTSAASADTSAASAAASAASAANSDAAASTEISQDAEDKELMSDYALPALTGAVVPVLAAVYALS